MTFRVHVRVVPRPGLLDPQGSAVQNALHALGFTEARDVRIGRAIEYHIEAKDLATATARAEAMCAQLLANPVTEDFVVTVDS